MTWLRGEPVPIEKAHPSFDVMGKSIEEAIEHEQFIADETWNALLPLQHFMFRLMADIGRLL